MNSQLWNTFLDEVLQNSRKDLNTIGTNASWRPLVQYLQALCITSSIHHLWFKSLARLSAESNVIDLASNHVRDELYSDVDLAGLEDFPELLWKFFFWDLQPLLNPTTSVAAGSLDCQLNEAALSGTVVWPQLSPTPAANWNKVEKGMTEPYCNCVANLVERHLGAVRAMLDKLREGLELHNRSVNLYVNKHVKGIGAAGWVPYPEMEISDMLSEATEFVNASVLLPCDLSARVEMLSQLRDWLWAAWWHGLCASFQHLKHLKAEAIAPIPAGAAVPKIMNERAAYDVLTSVEKRYLPLDLQDGLLAAVAPHLLAVATTFPGGPMCVVTFLECLDGSVRAKVLDELLAATDSQQEGSSDPTNTLHVTMHAWLQGLRDIRDPATRKELQKLCDASAFNQRWRGWMQLLAATARSRSLLEWVRTLKYASKRFRKAREEHRLPLWTLFFNCIGEGSPPSFSDIQVAMETDVVTCNKAYVSNLPHFLPSNVWGFVDPQAMVAVEGISSSIGERALQILRDFFEALDALAEDFLSSKEESSEASADIRGHLRMFTSALISSALHSGVGSLSPVPATVTQPAIHVATAAGRPYTPPDVAFCCDVLEGVEGLPAAEAMSQLSRAEWMEISRLFLHNGFALLHKLTVGDSGTSIAGKAMLADFTTPSPGKFLGWIGHTAMPSGPGSVRSWRPLGCRSEAARASGRFLPLKPATEVQRVDGDDDETVEFLRCFSGLGIPAGEHTLASLEEVFNAVVVGDTSIDLSGDGTIYSQTSWLNQLVTPYFEDVWFLFPRLRQLGYRALDTAVATAYLSKDGAIVDGAFHSCIGTVLKQWMLRAFAPAYPQTPRINAGGLDKSKRKRKRLRGLASGPAISPKHASLEARKLLRSRRQQPRRMNGDVAAGQVYGNTPGTTIMAGVEVTLIDTLGLPMIRTALEVSQRFATFGALGGAFQPGLTYHKLWWRYRSLPLYAAAARATAKTLPSYLRRSPTGVNPDTLGATSLPKSAVNPVVAAQEAAVRDLLSYSASAVYLPHVRAFLRRVRQDWLDEVLRVTKGLAPVRGPFRGLVPSPVGSQDRRVNEGLSITERFAFSLTYSGFQRLAMNAQTNAWRSRESPGQWGFDRLTEQGRLPSSATRKLEDHAPPLSDVFLSSTTESESKSSDLSWCGEAPDNAAGAYSGVQVATTRKLHRLGKLTLQVYAQQQRIIALCPTLSTSEREVALMRFARNPVTSSSEVVAFWKQWAKLKETLPASESETGRDIPPLPRSLFEIMIQQLNRTDVPVTGLPFMLDPKVLRTDIGKVCVYLLKSISRFLPEGTIHANVLRLFAPTENTKENVFSIPISVMKELLRVVSERPSASVASSLIRLFKSKPLHRDARMAILSQGVEFLAADVAVEDIRGMYEWAAQSAGRILPPAADKADAAESKAAGDTATTKKKKKDAGPQYFLPLEAYAALLLIRPNPSAVAQTFRGSARTWTTMPYLAGSGQFAKLRSALDEATQILLPLGEEEWYLQKVVLPLATQRDVHPDIRTLALLSLDAWMGVIAFRGTVVDLWLNYLHEAVTSRSSFLPINRALRATTNAVMEELRTRLLEQCDAAAWVYPWPLEPVVSGHEWQPLALPASDDEAAEIIDEELARLEEVLPKAAQCLQAPGLKASREDNFVTAPLQWLTLRRGQGVLYQGLVKHLKLLSSLIIDLNSRCMAFENDQVIPETVEYHWCLKAFSELQTLAARLRLLPFSFEDGVTTALTALATGSSDGTVSTADASPYFPQDAALLLLNRQLSAFQATFEVCTHEVHGYPFIDSQSHVISARPAPLASLCAWAGTLCRQGIALELSKGTSHASLARQPSSHATAIEFLKQTMQTNSNPLWHRVHSHFSDSDEELLQQDVQRLHTAATEVAKYSHDSMVSTFRRLLAAAILAHTLVDLAQGPPVPKPSTPQALAVSCGRGQVPEGSQLSDGDTWGLWEEDLRQRAVVEVLTAVPVLIGLDPQLRLAVEHSLLSVMQRVTMHSALPTDAIPSPGSVDLRVQGGLSEDYAASRRIADAAIEFAPAVKDLLEALAQCHPLHERSTSKQRTQKRAASLYLELFAFCVDVMVRQTGVWQKGRPVGGSAAATAPENVSLTYVCTETVMTAMASSTLLVGLAYMVLPHFGYFAHRMLVATGQVKGTFTLLKAAFNLNDKLAKKPLPPAVQQLFAALFDAKLWDLTGRPLEPTRPLSASLQPKLAPLYDVLGAAQQQYRDAAVALNSREQRLYSALAAKCLDWAMLPFLMSLEAVRGPVWAWMRRQAEEGARMGCFASGQRPQLPLTQYAEAHWDEEKFCANMASLLRPHHLRSPLGSVVRLQHDEQFEVAYNVIQSLLSSMAEVPAHTQAAERKETEESAGRSPKRQRIGSHHAAQLASQPLPVQLPFLQAAWRVAITVAESTCWSTGAAPFDYIAFEKGGSSRWRNEAVRLCFDIVRLAQRLGLSTQARDWREFIACNSGWRDSTPAAAEGFGWAAVDSEDAGEVKGAEEGRAVVEAEEEEEPTGWEAAERPFEESAGPNDWEW